MTNLKSHLYLIQTCDVRVDTAIKAAVLHWCHTVSLCHTNPIKEQS